MGKALARVGRADAPEFGGYSLILQSLTDCGNTVVLSYR